MRLRALSNLVALLIALAFTAAGNSVASAASEGLTGTWSNESEWGGTLLVAQTGDKVKWEANSNNALWTQTFSGSRLGSYSFTGDFIQSESGSTPRKYTGSIRFRVTDPCHFTIAYAGGIGIGPDAMVSHLQGLEFAKTSCTLSTPSASSTPSTPSASSTPSARKIVWPTLPDALVSIETVSNGCGGGDAGTDPLHYDDSAFVDSEIPFADDFAWSKALKYNVNFREACKQHDAGYSHAKVIDMALNGGKIIDYFTWTKKMVDDKFLEDMIKICDASIPKDAEVALNNCKNNGGFHTVSGAKTRYDVVAATTYTSKLWRGLGFYQEPPRLTGTWKIQGFKASPWSFIQSTRSVIVKWTGGSTQPKAKGEFRGTIISHDKDSSIKGFYVNTNNGVTTSPQAMTFSWNPKKPDQLRSSTGFTLKRN
ncbi:MAG: hypothetical protein Q8L08_04780 [Candidatus Nanopelagicaceae bacterium]|nr:hypothetical protein [Candidatus Nanopelagicaceae bacterium]